MKNRQKKRKGSTDGKSLMEYNKPTYPLLSGTFSMSDGYLMIMEFDGLSDRYPME
jgi:hypothetical protein